MIYFVQAGVNGPVKIGYAKDVAARVTALSTAHYEELRILAVVTGNRYDEKAFHDKLENARMRGEWFEWSADVSEAVMMAKEGKTPRRARKERTRRQRDEQKRPYTRTLSVAVEGSDILLALKGVSQAEVVRRAKAAGHSLSEGAVWMARDRGIKTVRVEEALRAAVQVDDAAETEGVTPPRASVPASP